MQVSQSCNDLGPMDLQVQELGVNEARPVCRPKLMSDYAPIGLLKKVNITLSKS